MQGFASGSLDEDAYAPRFFVDQGLEVIVSQSYSKNLGQSTLMLLTCAVAVAAGPFLLVVLLLPAAVAAALHRHSVLRAGLGLLQAGSRNQLDKNKQVKCWIPKAISDFFYEETP